MKNLIFIAAFLSLTSLHSMTGSGVAIGDFLDSHFEEISYVGEFSYLGGTNQCDEEVDAYVVGNRGSGETAYSCSICLINDGGIATIDSNESYCIRD